MKKHVLVVIMVGLAFGVPAVADDVTKKDSEQLQGRWTAVGAFDAAGKVQSVAEDDPKHFTFEFRVDMIITKLKKHTIEGTYKLASSKSPKELDVVRRRGDEKLIFKGIYAIDGDRLKVCLAGTGNERPKEFKTGKGIEFAVELKRVKQ